MRASHFLACRRSAWRGSDDDSRHSENLYFLRNLFDRVRGSFSLLLGDSLRPQQRLPIADRYSEIRSSKITHHGEVNPDDFPFAVKKRTARTARSSLRIVDNLVGQDITNMALRDNRADQMSASEFFHYLFRITFGCLGNRLKCLFAGAGKDSVNARRISKKHDRPSADSRAMTIGKRDFFDSRFGKISFQ